jgi:EmrB/QacA subfamily drug resistance transporter
MQRTSAEQQTLKRAALIVATLSSFITPFLGSSVNIALPSIQEQFHIDAVLLSWIAASFLLAAAVSLVPFGRLADIYGRKKVFAVGMITLTGSSLLAGLSFSAPMLIALRICQGIGSAMIYATGIAILTSVFPPWERGKVLGINVAAVYVGLSIGPFLGGLLTEYLTWRSIFFVIVPPGCGAIFLIWKKLEGEWAEARGEAFDFVGSFVYGSGITAVMYGLTLLPGIKGIWLILAGAAGIGLFVFWENRTVSPVFEVHLFRHNRVFALSGLAALINYSATFAVTFLMSLYLQYIKGLDPQEAGLVLVAQPVVMASFSPFAGRLSDRIEPRFVASGGMALTALGLFLFVFLDQETTIAYILLCLVVLGFGFAFFSSPNTNAIMSSVEKRHYGIASGTVGTMRVLGQMFSMGIATVIFAVYIGRVQITAVHYPEFLKSVRLAFVTFSSLCLVGILASFARGRIRP